MSSGKLKGADSEKKITVRAREDLVAEFDEWAENRGFSRSEAIREQMRQAVERGNPEIGADLEDDHLAAAYRALVKASGENNRIDVDAARTVAAEASKWKKSVVQGACIEPLRQKGYLKPLWGTILVYPPEAVPVQG